MKGSTAQGLCALSISSEPCLLALPSAQVDLEKQSVLQQAMHVGRVERIYCICILQCCLPSDLGCILCGVAHHCFACNEDMLELMEPAQTGIHVSPNTLQDSGELRIYDLLRDGSGTVQDQFQAHKTPVVRLLLDYAFFCTLGRGFSHILDVQDACSAFFSTLFLLSLAHCKLSSCQQPLLSASVKNSLSIG